jgi:GWxTD domain-containing protein
MYDAPARIYCIALWEKRNPNPGSPENAFEKEHYRRIAYANEQFAANVPGWKTDRGRHLHHLRTTEFR